MLKNNSTAEGQLLGCWIHGAPLSKNITEAVFSTATHKTIFKTISELIARGVNVDLSILASELENQGKLDQCGGYAAVAELTNNAFLANISYYEDEVLNAFHRRKLWEESTFLKEALERGESPEKLHAVFQERTAQVIKPKSITNSGISFKDLLEKEFPPENFYVDGLITSGLTVLTGGSKIGKSWTALQLVTALDQGGYFLGKLKAEKCDCLYLALEDTEKRIQKRLKKQGIVLFNGSRLETKRRTITDLRLFLEDNPQYKVIIIDTFQKMMGLDDMNDYAVTVRGMSALKAIADDLNRAIIVIHHTRKGSDQDADHMESALGSTGINATADCTLTLRRKRGEAQATLSATGRDIEDTSFSLDWDKDCCSWTITESGPLVPSMPPAQKEVLDLLESENRAWTTAEIISVLGKSKQSVSNLLSEMRSKGFIESPEKGLWQAKNEYTSTSSLREGVQVYCNEQPSETTTSTGTAPSDGQEPEIW